MKNVDLIISGGTIITQNARREIITNGAIVINKSDIVAVDTDVSIQSQYVAKKTINAVSNFVFPGLINTHTHLFQTFIKGLGQGLSLYEWVDSIAAPSAVAMAPREAYLSAMLGCMESLHCGTTTILDFMYSMPTTRLYHEVSQAFHDIGMRGILGIGLMETGEQHKLSPSQFRPVNEALEEWKDLSPQFLSDRITLALAPEVAFGITSAGIESIQRFAAENNMLVTIHVNETDDDDQAMLQDYGQRCIPFLETLGFWGPGVLAVHCVKMQPEDIEIFTQHDVKISHNPVSNMYLGVGPAPIVEMLEKGLTISLATDGAGSNNSQDMIETMKCAGLLHRIFKQNPAVMSAQMVLDMATIEGARSIGQATRIGSIEPGKQADMFIFDPLHPKAVPVLDPVSSLVFSSGSDSVKTTIIAGKVVLEDGKITSINERELLLESQTVARDLSRRVGTTR